MDETVRQLLIFSAGILLTWGMSWARTFLAKRIKVNSPEARGLKRLDIHVQLHDFLIQAGADRAALQARGTVTLIDAVKSDDKERINEALDLLSAGESQYAASLSARILRREGEEAKAVD
jgi:hypothetical protein